MTIALTIVGGGLVVILVLSLLLYRRSTNPGFFDSRPRASHHSGHLQIHNSTANGYGFRVLVAWLPFPFSVLVTGPTEPTEAMSRIFLFMSVMGILLIALGLSLLAFLKPSANTQSTPGQVP